MSTRVFISKNQASVIDEEHYGILTMTQNVACVIYNGNINLVYTQNLRDGKFYIYPFKNKIYDNHQIDSVVLNMLTIDEPNDYLRHTKLVSVINYNPKILKILIGIIDMLARLDKELMIIREIPHFTNSWWLVKEHLKNKDSYKNRDIYLKTKGKIMYAFSGNTPIKPIMILPDDQDIVCYEIDFLIKNSIEQIFSN